MSRAIAAIGGIAPWFGSKRRLAPRIVELAGKHNAWWEPFCGSLAVTMAKPKCVMETVNDLHGDLINLARVLAMESPAKQLYSDLSRIVFHEELFNEAAERLAGSTPEEIGWDVCRARDFMICSWFGRNGVIGTASYNNSFCVRFTSNGGHAAKRWL